MISHASHPAPPSGRAISALLLNAFIWGVSWWPFRWLNEHGLHSLWATAAIYLLAWLLVLARSPGLALGALANPALLALAAAAGVTNACFNWGVATGDVVRVVLLFYLMPIWSILFGRVLLGEPLRARSIGLVLLAVTGAVIVLWRPGTGLPLPESRADWLGLIGGVGFALTNILLRKYSGRPATALASAMFAGGTIMPTTVALAMASGIGGTAVPWPALASAAYGPLALVAVAFVAANLALQYGAARLPARVTAVVMLSEVVFAAGSAVWLGGQMLTMQLVLGAALIIGTSLISALQRH
ncbi:MAG TPA: DMT family transporter [Burkholderiaceae bacterium]|nr:DMT family transporter [Burkholderiaceae bacterium]